MTKVMPEDLSSASELLLHLPIALYLERRIGPSKDAIILRPSAALPFPEHSNPESTEPPPTLRS